MYEEEDVQLVPEKSDQKLPDPHVVLQMPGWP